MKKNRSIHGLSLCVIKMLRIMKLTVFLMLISFIGVFASETYSQTTKLSLKVEKISLEDFLIKIEDQSEFRFFYSGKIDVKKKVSGEFKNKKITEILDNIKEEAGIQYEVMGRQIVLSPINTEKTIKSIQQRNPISGTVTDENGEPLPGVTVLIKGTSRGSVTNMDGGYSISNVPDDAILQFSFVGMLMQEVIVGNKTNINITLVADAIGIEEVVAVGYGTQKKSNLTGALTVIKSDQIDNRSSSTVSQLLQGQAAGVNLGISNTGFAPGAKMNISIRGMGSINGHSPLTVIDGVPGILDNINPEDIESITILKDAASSAIYGARGAHGVILVTTKSGGNKKLTASYSGMVSINSPMPLPDVLDSYTYARVHNEAALNRGSSRYFQDATVDRILAYQNQDWEYLDQFMPEGATHYGAYPLSDGSYAVKWKGHANNDWHDIFFGNSVNQKHNFTIDGGTENISYYFSAGYLNDNSYINYADDTFERYNISGKITSKITDWWDFTIQTRFTKGIKTNPTLNGGGSDYLRLYFLTLTSAPTNALYDSYGNVNARIGDNRNLVLALQEGGTRTTENTDQLYTFYTTLRPAKGWQVNADFTYKTHGVFGTNAVRWVPYYMVDQSVRYDRSSNSISSKHNNDYYWTTNVYSSYDLNMGSGHKIKVTGGMQMEQGKTRYLTNTKKDLIVQDVPSIQTAIGDLSGFEHLGNWSTQGYFGRFNYNLKEKYLFESNVRYDGTSRFSEGNRWGFFPSVSGGWAASKENFWEPIAPYVNSLKLRASWGSLGNQSVASYQDLELIPIRSSTVNWVYSNGGSRPIGYTNTPSIVSPGLTWETVTTTNIGIDMGFLEQKLQFGFDIFERNTTDMIGPAEALPGVLGSTGPKTNNASLQTRGWEIELGWKQKVSDDFSYSVNMNVYDNKVKITKYNNPNKLLSSWYEGKEVGEIWGYESNGLFQTQEEIDNHADQSFFYGTWRTGDVKYEDLDGDKVITNGTNTLDDHGDMKIIGNSSSRYRFGLTGRASYKGFDFSMLWSGVAKRDVAQHFRSYGSQAYFGFVSQSWSSIHDIHLDYYRDREGDKYAGLYEGEKNINLDGWLPRPYVNTSENAKNRHTNSRYLLNGAYLRLQNIQLGYNLPSRLIDRLGLSKVRMFVSGDNLLTFSHLPKGVDPVATVGYEGNWFGTTYGAGRVLAFGITINTK